MTTTTGRSPRVRRLLAALGLVGLALGLVVGLTALPGPAGASGWTGWTGTAHADTGDEGRITSYALAYDIRSSGVVHVTETMRYDFGTTAHHGPERLLDTRESVSGGDRVYGVEHVTASSSSGAPSDVSVDDIGDQTRIRIGDPDRTVTGPQEYVLAYDLTGALNLVQGTDPAGHAGKGARHGELYWDAAGPNWDIPLDDVRVTVTAPGGIGKVRCLFGRPGSTDACGSARLSGGIATFVQSSVQPGEVLTFVTSFSTADVHIATPTVEDTRVFRIDPMGVVVSIALLALGGFALVFRISRHRDRRYAGLTPGLTPPAGSVGVPDEPAPRQGRDEVAVQFAPPDISPAEAGMLLRKRPSLDDTAATLVDLAVRGYVHLEQSSTRKRGSSWTIVEQRPPDESLRPHERDFLTRLFARQRSEPRTVTLNASSSRGFVNAARDLDSAVRKTAVEHRWLRRPGRSRAGNSGVVPAVIVSIAFAVILLPILSAMTFGIGLATHQGLIVSAAFVAIVLAAIGLFFKPGRLPEGYALYQQVLGFRRYLDTAEAEQLRFEEGENIFSRYLPWAIVFGVTERWAQICERLAQQGRIPPDVGWYSGPGAWSYASNGVLFGTSFTSTVQSSGTPISSSGGSAGGSSGFGGGGFAGGGGGGGGGGSW